MKTFKKDSAKLFKNSTAAKLAAKNAALKAKSRHAVEDSEDDEDDEDEQPRAKKRTTLAPPPKATKSKPRHVEEDEDDEDDTPKARKRSRVVEADEDDEDGEEAAPEAVPMYVRGYAASIRDNLKDVRGWTKARASEHASFATADKALVAALKALDTIADREADEG